MIDLPPYTIKQPEEYLGYRRVQRYKYYKSIGFMLTCLSIEDTDKRLIYVKHAQQYQPPPDIKYYRYRHGNC